ncbi:neutral zinc metallopeptidase [Nocardiopsis trehalosi]|jgi:predicted metalloprotease|uniref:neutral zinc metallopeptidase n=1 Tax=Nocardiopsis trehalosi TaxID=109329 RepID=UPI000832985B|nr:neutral zinc metallopeptidase [Nocardiopsis trehalosi]
MAERRIGGGGAPGRPRGRARYAPPAYARRPRQRLGVGVSVVLVTGLAALGLSAFLGFSALFAPPAHSGAVAAAPEAVPAAAPTDADAGAGPEVLTDNPLYATGAMAEVTCEAPRLDPDDKASMEHFLHEMTDCLDAAWAEQFSGTGMEFEEPERVYWYAAGRSPCGTYPTPGTAAFYCRANKGLYLGVEDIVRNSAESRHPEAYTFLLSHEYAHHVQGEAGILGYFHGARGSEADSGDRDRMTRRSELQANCLGGLFLGAARSSFPIGAAEEEHILVDAELRGDFSADDRTHGSPDNGRLWTAHGMDRGDPAACDTWSAPQGVVE